jgi:hypothetical protein
MASQSRRPRLEHKHIQIYAGFISHVQIEECETLVLVSNWSILDDAPLPDVGKSFVIPLFFNVNHVVSTLPSSLRLAIVWTPHCAIRCAIVATKRLQRPCWDAT